MHCEQWQEQLLLWAYDELPSDQVAACQAHIDSCPGCRAEWQTLRGVQRALDFAPQAAVQLDLAGVCLRMAERERHGQVVRRWAYAVTALAASLIVAVATQWLQFQVEPGHLVVAWQQPAPVPAQLALQPAGQGRSSAAAQSLVQQEDGDAHDRGADPRAVDRRAVEQRAGGRLFAAVGASGLSFDRHLSAAQWEARRYAQPAYGVSTTPGGAATYDRLRRELFDEQQQNHGAVSVPPDA